MKIFIVITVFSLIVAVGVLKLFSKEKYREDRDLIFLGAMGFALILSFFCIFLIDLNLPREYILDKEMELVSFKDTVNIEGKFFLGTGNIGSELYYVFYQKEEDGGIKFGKLPVKEVTIYETGEKGYIQIYNLKLKEKRYYSLGFSDLLNKRKYKVFIPKGSILQEFKLDLE